MLLAAGLGSRLQPLTELCPKPIVPVANKPLAAFAMEHLARMGVTAIVANTHPRPHAVEMALKAACPRDVDLRFSRELTLLGTGGGLRKARPLFDDPQASVIVMNGDTLFAPDLARAYAAHRARGAVATMILRRTSDPSRYGAIGIDDEGWVRTLLGRPERRRVAEELMFTGVHILAPEAFVAGIGVHRTNGVPSLGRPRCTGARHRRRGSMGRFRHDCRVSSTESRARVRFVCLARRHPRDAQGLLPGH